MADKPPTTPHAAAEAANPVTSPDRTAFRRALRLFGAALRADWAAREGHAGPDATVLGSLRRTA